MISTASIEPTTGTAHASSVTYHGVSAASSDRRAAGTCVQACCSVPLASSSPASTTSPTMTARPWTTSVQASASSPPTAL